MDGLHEPGAVDAAPRDAAPQERHAEEPPRVGHDGLAAGDAEGGTGGLRVGLREEAHLPVGQRHPEAAHLLGLHDEHGTQRGLPVAAQRGPQRRHDDPAGVAGAAVERRRASAPVATHPS